MQPRIRVLVTFIFVVVLIASLYIFTDWFSQITGYFLGEGETKQLALCLSKQGTEFYGSVFCAECEKTKELFGQSFKFISDIDCGRNKENCPDIENIPAWYINKKIYYGFKNISELKQLSACE